MGFVSRDEALAKGPVVRALDEVSQKTDARQLLTTLRDQLKAGISYPHEQSPGVPDIRLPDFVSLANILQTHLLRHWSGLGKTPHNYDMEAYLNRYWFGPQPREFARFPTRGIYGMGLLKAIDSSLRGKPNPKPIDGYWFIHCDRLEVISLESERQVTLLIATPAPVAGQYSSPNPSAACEAWVTSTTDKMVGFEVSPPDLDPDKVPTLGDPSTGAVDRRGYRICTYKIVGGP